MTDALQPPVDRDVALARIAWSARAVARSRAAAVVSLSLTPAEAVQGAVVAGDADLDGTVREVVAAALTGRSGDTGPTEGDVDGYRVLVVPLRAHLTERRRWSPCSKEAVGHWTSRSASC